MKGWRKLRKQAEALTDRLVTCPMAEFDKVKEELYALKRRAAAEGCLCKKCGEVIQVNAEGLCIHCVTRAQAREALAKGAAPGRGTHWGKE
jgi:hypothetical protein